MHVPFVRRGSVQIWDETTKPLERLSDMDHVAG